MSYPDEDGNAPPEGELYHTPSGRLYQELRALEGDDTSERAVAIRAEALRRIAKAVLRRFYDGEEEKAYRLSEDAKISGEELFRLLEERHKQREGAS